MGVTVSGFTLNGLCGVALKNAELRNKNDGKIKTDTNSMLKHTSTEVVEAMEAYTKAQWQLNKNETEIEMEHFSSELADIICCCLIIAGRENINIENAIKDCIEKNRKRAEGVGDKL